MQCCAMPSQGCRSLDTATLMDPEPVEPFELRNSFFRDRSTAAEQTAQIQDYLRRQPNRGRHCHGYPVQHNCSH